MSDAKQTLPGHETQSSEMNCPSCGRFVGAVTKCPYCGSKVEKRMSLVAVRWAAVLLSTIGVFLLYLMAKHREVPVVMIGDVQPTMNFGQIRVIGTVAGDARTFRNGGMGFNVSDGTGTMMVFVSQKQAKDLVDLNLVPRAGDSINFVGGLSTSDEQTSMRLLSVRELQLVRAVAPSVRMADVDASLVGSSILVAGQVVGVSIPPPDTRRPHEIRVSDGTAELAITCWAAEFEQIKGRDALEGAYVRVRVSVDTFRNNLQIKLASGLDLEILDAPPPAVAAPKNAAERAAAALRKDEAPAPKRELSRGRLAPPASIASISAAQQGETVKVRGRVSAYRAPEPNSRQPFSLVLDDGEGAIRVTYWASVDDILDPKPSVGAEFEVEGVVDVYQDKPQIKVESGLKMKQTASAAPAAPPADAVSVADLSAADKDQTRRVVGTLGPARDLGKGTAYVLADGDASIDLVLWHSAVPARVRNALSEGARVAALGVVGEYEGRLQLKASPGASVQVLP